MEDIDKHTLFQSLNRIETGNVALYQEFQTLKSEITLIKMRLEKIEDGIREMSNARDTYGKKFEDNLGRPGT